MKNGKGHFSKVFLQCKICTHSAKDTYRYTLQKKFKISWNCSKVIFQAKSQQTCSVQMKQIYDCPSSAVFFWQKYKKICHTKYTQN